MANITYTVAFFVVLSLFSYSVFSISQENCDLSKIESLTGKTEAVALVDYKVVGQALVGPKNMYSIKVIQYIDKFFLILSQIDGLEMVIMDVMPWPKVEENQSFVYASCYSDFNSGIVDSLAIAKYENEQFLEVLVAWTIDFNNVEFQKADKDSVICVNESYGD